VSDVSSPSARDRADFERVLRRALDTPDIRSALHADPTGRAAKRLRAWALEAAGEIGAAADEEYRAYREARDRRPRGRLPAVDGTLGPLLLVLTPLVSTLSAAVLLVVGYSLRLAAVSADFSASAVIAGWVLAVIAAVTAIAGLGVLLRAALRGGDEKPGERPSAAGTYGGRGAVGGRRCWNVAYCPICAAGCRKLSTGSCRVSRASCRTADGRR
jgi:hypothetical protein